jgi:hypothetical protein
MARVVRVAGSERHPRNALESSRAHHRRREVAFARLAVSAATSRQQRRAAARRRRSVQREIRVPAHRQTEFEARRDAQLSRLNGTPASAERVDGAVVVLAETAEPQFVTWAILPRALRLLGLELHPETLRDVEAVRAAGRVAVITLIEGVVIVDGVRLTPLSRGSQVPS